MKVPLRVDFGGGWLDVPQYAVEGGYIVNCAITPKVSLKSWPYEIGSGLGGSAAKAILDGMDPIKSELDFGVGWQDPAIILETGACVWRSGKRPVLELKMNPDFLLGKMALYWTGKSHNNKDNSWKKRDYKTITRAGHLAHQAVKDRSLKGLAEAVNISYIAQLEEGMDNLPSFETELAAKYCGGGWGGYALYLFEKRPKHKDLIPIEPYLK